MAETFHQSNERLELYALNRLSDSDVIQIEEHLLACDSCRDRLEHNATFAVALGDELKSSPAFEASRSGWFNWIRPQFAFAGALAVAILAVVLLWNHNSGLAPVATIQLTAIRGAAPTVHAARELDVSFKDANPATSSPTVEIVDANGSKVWSGVPEIVEGVRRVRIRKVLASGDYLARYYDSPGNAPREYAFTVQ